jgi:dihydrofolate reductase
MSLTIVVARAANGCIGKDGKLPWNIPEDSTEKVLTTFWATLTSAPTMEAISTFFSTGKSARRLAFQFEEYL